MPFISSSTVNKSRYLLSGFSQSGKTTSLITFLYGSNDYWSDTEHAAAVEYAGGKKMVALVCPGETGVKALPPNTEHFTRYYYESRSSEDITKVEWSINVLREFEALTKQVLKDKPDILAVDGGHNLWDHMMNRTTSGEYLAGMNLNENADGKAEPYRAARFYSQAHKAFGQYLSGLYTSQIPLVIVTTLEAWEAGKGENPSKKSEGFDAPRYLWPAIPGEMAKMIVSKFDARLSARLEPRCYYGEECEHTKEKALHHVWQFYPRGDVAGVGIKGLKVTKKMEKTPYIHQSYEDLQWLITR